MIVEQEEIFSKLGTTEEAQKIRARMQAAGLLSGISKPSSKTINLFVRYGVI